MLLSMVCVMNSVIAMELMQQPSWCEIPEILIRIAAPSEQQDKRSFCLVNKQWSTIASDAVSL
jgi:hypothetical protein